MAKILIIDDEAPIRKMLTKFLKSKGFDIISAKDGDEGIALYKKEHPDLVITDLIMPNKEGLESIRELKAMDKDVKIIAISGGGTQEPQMYLNLSKKFGAIRTFSKPVENERLLSTIKEILS